MHFANCNTIFNKVLRGGHFLALWFMEACLLSQHHCTKIDGNILNSFSISKISIQIASALFILSVAPSQMSYTQMGLEFVLFRIEYIGKGTTVLILMKMKYRYLLAFYSAACTIGIQFSSISISNSWCVTAILVIHFRKVGFYHRRYD